MPVTIRGGAYIGTVCGALEYYRTQNEAAGIERTGGNRQWMDSRTIRMDGMGARRQEHTVKIRKCIRTGRTRHNQRITEITECILSSRITETVRTRISSRITEITERISAAELRKRSEHISADELRKRSEPVSAAELRKLAGQSVSAEQHDSQYPMFCAIFSW